MNSAVLPTYIVSTRNAGTVHQLMIDEWFHRAESFIFWV